MSSAAVARALWFKDPCEFISRRDKQTQTVHASDRFCTRCRQDTDEALRLLDAKKKADVLKKQQDDLRKATKLLQPDDWERQQRQQEEERQLQKKRQEEEAEQKKVDRLKALLQENDLLKHESRPKRSEWQKRVLLRALDSAPTAATKHVRVPPLTQPSAPRRLTKLPALPLQGKMETL
jgi:hypothetical protein